MAGGPERGDAPAIASDFLTIGKGFVGHEIGVDSFAAAHAALGAQLPHDGGLSCQRVAIGEDRRTGLPCQIGRQGSVVEVRMGDEDMRDMFTLSQRAHDACQMCGAWRSGIDHRNATAFTNQIGVGAAIGEGGGVVAQDAAQAGHDLLGDMGGRVELIGLAHMGVLCLCLEMAEQVHPIDDL